MLKDYATSLGLGDIFKSPPEKVCPLTKQLIVEKLRDLAADNNVSIRQILGVAMADGVADDYQLLGRLEEYGKPVDDFTNMPKVEMDTYYDARNMGYRVRFKSGDRAMDAFTEDPPPIG